MMAKKDYYDCLGVTRTATITEIKSAYRSMAKKCHPDLHPGDAAAEVQFKEITEAYEVLSDTQKRAAYDQYGHAAFEQGAAGFGGFNGFTGFGGSFSDLFEEVFNGFMGGAHRSDTQDRRGNDVKAEVTLTLKEAYTGVKKKIDVMVQVPCSDCGGVGGKGTETCSVCKGRGRVRRQNGFFMMETPCAVCGGTGQRIKDPCMTCKGTGRVKKKKTLEVNIPAGVETGVRMRLAGEGEAGLRGGEPGDLYVFVTVKENKLFVRHEQHLACDLPVSMTTAALGGTVDVPTIDGGKTTIKIPSGTQTGYETKLKGKGMPVLRGASFGDLFVRVRVETPTNLSKKQKELLTEFAKEENAGPAATDFMAGVKKFFEELV